MVDFSFNVHVGSINSVIKVNIVNFLLQICWFFRLSSLPRQRPLGLTALTLIAAGLNNGDNAAQKCLSLKTTLHKIKCSHLALSLTHTHVFSRVHRAGPRKEIYFEPQCVKAGILTCGGLCPGLNDVIRQVE
jgi:hypothetical protein